MLKIDRLTLRLPAGMRDRAAPIVNLIARELRTAPLHRAGRIDRLTIPPLEIQRMTSDDEIARRVAESTIDEISDTF